MLRIFFDISTGFRFSKISVECSVHLCSCPWVILQLNNYIKKTRQYISVKTYKARDSIALLDLGTIEVRISGQSRYVPPPIYFFFGGKYDLIQLHRQIMHQNDGISMRN